MSQNNFREVPGGLNFVHCPFCSTHVWLFTKSLSAYVVLEEDGYEHVHSCIGVGQLVSDWTLAFVGLGTAYDLQLVEWRSSARETPEQLDLFGEKKIDISWLW